MRYTTIIDLRDWPMLYRSPTIRLLHLHLALSSGYHAEDRDKSPQSLRQLAAETGLTFSAVRHALKKLQTAGLITSTGGERVVTKYVMPKDIPARPRARKETNGYSAEAWKIINYDPQEYDEQKKLQTMLQQQHKTRLMWVYEQLYRLWQNGDKTTEKYLRANAKEYQIDRDKMQRNHE